MDIQTQRSKVISANASNYALKSLSKEFFNSTVESNYSYSFDWLGRPIIQYPQDIVAFQEIVHSTKPDLIIETGIAHGGSLALSASLLCLLDVMEGADPKKSNRKVLGVDIDIREHNKVALDQHPLRYKMELIQGSSIDSDIVAQVKKFSENYNKILVSLDSNHTHDHVMAELISYADLVSIGSYCIVYDTVIEDLPPGSFPERPWDVGNNPKTAVHKFLQTHTNFVIDNDIDNKLLISVAPEGYLKRIL